MTVVGSAQKFPAGHSRQVTLLVVLQADVTYCPVPQTPHTVQPDALAMAEYVTPGWHPAHTVFWDVPQGTAV